MAIVAEEFNCLSNEEISTFKINWRIPRSTLQPILRQKGGVIKSSKYKLKFHYSSWYLKIEENFQEDQGENFRNDRVLKLYLDEADVEECMIWTRKKYNITRNGVINWNYHLGHDKFSSWGTNLKQTGTIVAYVSYLKEDRGWKSDYVLIECEVEVKAIVNNCRITPTLKLRSQDTQEDSLLKLSLEKPEATPSVSLLQSDKPLQMNNGTLLESGLYSDFTFKVGAKTFKAHRAILAVQSEYFDTMFKCGLKESNDCASIEVTDVEPEIFEALLKYLYTKETPANLDTIAKDLLVAADKYLVRKLVEICEERLFRTIDHDTCVEVLIFADMYNCKKLKGEAVSFIKPRLKQILKTEAWKELMKNFTDLALEVLDKAV